MDAGRLLAQLDALAHDIKDVRFALQLARARGEGVREIARQLGRSPSTISRELRRNAATRGGGLEYRAHTAQWHADRAAMRPKPAKLLTNPTLREYVQDRLAGNIATPGGRSIDTGLEVYFCDPQSPWQRGSNENTNGLLRQYFPKRTEISHYTQAELDDVAETVDALWAIWQIVLRSQMHRFGASASSERVSRGWRRGRRRS